jgi:membrane-bound lytic murein transglycosylase D
VPDLEHRARRADTLSQLAAAHRVSLAAHMRTQSRRPPALIRIGQVVKLPGDAAGAGRPSTAAVAPSVVLARTDADALPGGTYVVRSGDSIERIAGRLGIAADELLAANSLRNKNVIYAGQTLRLPGGPTAETAMTAAVADDAAALATDVADEAPSSAAEPAELDADALNAALVAAVDADARGARAPSAADTEAAIEAAIEADTEENAFASVQADLAADPSDYTVSNARIEVQALETLGHYADWLEIPTQRLRDLNRLSFNQAVVIGQRLALDFSRVDAGTFEQRRVAYQRQRQGEFFASWQIEDVANHVVRPGESLWVLAGRTYEVPVWLLRQYNPDIDLDRVVPGMVVKFPRLRAIDGEGEAPPQTLEAVADNAA